LGDWSRGGAELKKKRRGGFKKEGGKVHILRLVVSYHCPQSIGELGGGGRGRNDGRERSRTGQPKIKDGVRFICS